MIPLRTVQTAGGEVAVILRRSDRAVGYVKDGVLQTLIDARGHNLAPHVTAAVDVLLQEKVRQALVLGYGGGAASTLLHRAGVDVFAVDCDPCAKPLAQLFFRAPPCLDVAVSDAAAYVERAAGASFDGVLIDFQDSFETPRAYLSQSFWRAVERVLRPRGMVIVNVTRWLHGGRDWGAFQAALGLGGFDAVALSDEHGAGNRILVTARGATAL